MCLGQSVEPQRVNTPPMALGGDGGVKDELPLTSPPLEKLDRPAKSETRRRCSSHEGGRSLYCSDFDLSWVLEQKISTAPSQTSSKNNTMLQRRDITSKAARLGHAFCLRQNYYHTIVRSSIQIASNIRQPKG